MILNGPAGEEEPAVHECGFIRVHAASDDERSCPATWPFHEAI